MCGFLISISKKNIDYNNFKNSFEKIKHRGIDDQIVKNLILNLKNGQKINISYGFARLSIQDPLPRSNQPFIKDNKKYLFFNGEIYNFKDLAHLENFNLKTQSDTEVLFNMLEKYNFDAFEKLNGMWSLAFLNLEKNFLSISRDRYGVKPLFYYKDKNTITISSNITSIKNLYSSKVSVNIKSFKEYMDFGYNYENKNLFNEIKQIKNGYCYRFDFTKWDFIEYKRYFFSKDYLKQNFTYDLYNDFRKSVERRLISDRPVGILLSGGLDSSLILSCLHTLKKTENLTAYIGYKDKNTEDFIFANKITQEIPIKKKFLEINSSTLSLEDFNEICRHQENLFPLIGNVVSTYIMYKLISKDETKVVIDGSGGDELFAGYDYRYIYFILQHHIECKDIKSFLKAFLDTKFNYKILYFKFILRKFIPFFRKLKKNKYLKYKNDLINDPIFKKGLNFNDVLRIDAFEGRLQHYLDHLDRNSMAFGLENRSPFLDLQIIKYINTNLDKKVNNSTYKVELRNLFDRFTKLSSQHRQKKSGFSFGIDSFLLKNKEYFKSIIDSSNIIGDVVYKDKLFKDVDTKISNYDTFTIFSRASTAANIEKQII